VLETSTLRDYQEKIDIPSLGSMGLTKGVANSLGTVSFKTREHVMSELVRGQKNLNV
jgi:hypothetical protein